jgi:phosphorylcholine metabolism protein LicD
MSGEHDEVFPEKCSFRKTPPGTDNIAHTNTLKRQSIEPEKKKQPERRKSQQHRRFVVDCTYIFMEEAKVFYAQSSSQMIRKQGEPDEKAMRREIREREMQALGQKKKSGRPFRKPRSLLRPLFHLVSTVSARNNTLWL